MPRAISSQADDLPRKPRVHIAYQLKTAGGPRKIELPFVVGVMADLSGKLQEGKELPSVDQRKFDEFDVDKFDGKMAAIAPRVEFFVERTIGQPEAGEDDRMKVDITFRKMDDFSPEAVVRQVAPLAKLLEAREQLTNLMRRSDGRSSVEDMLGKLLDDPALLRAVATAPAPERK